MHIEFELLTGAFGVLNIFGAKTKARLRAFAAVKFNMAAGAAETRDI